MSFRTALSRAALVVALGIAMPGAADEPALPPVSTVPTPDAEEMLIQGERGTLSLLDTPQSVATFSQAEIEGFGIKDVRDTFRLVPNTNASPSNRGNNGITIRGINSEGINGAGGNLRPLASLVIDGATQSFAGLRRGARGLWDVENIEIFRGPQSTLQGRNALAGVVLVETQDPTYTWEAALRGRGSYLVNGGSASPDPDYWNGAFMLSGPLWDDQLAFRIVGEIEEDEHGIRVDADRLPFDSDEQFARRQSQMKSLDEGEYHQLRGKLLAEPDFLAGLRVEGSVSYSFDAPGIVDVTDREEDTRLGLQAVDWDQYTLAEPPRNSELRETSVLNSILDINHDLTENLRLLSLTAYTRTDVGFVSPFPEEFLREEDRIDDDWTQDLRFEYTPSESFYAMLGGFYARTQNEQDSRVAVANGFVVIQDQLVDRRTENWAAVGALRIRPWSWLEITGELRWDRDRFEFDGLFRQENQREEGERETDAWLPKVAVSVDLTDNHVVTATVSRGYRAGFIQPDSGAVSLVDPEFLWSYELAYRGTFFDDRLTFAGNVFYYDWDDQQITFFNGTSNITVNAGTSTVYGLEIGLRASPIPGLLMAANFGYLKTEINDWVTPTMIDRSGSEFPEAPETSASVLLSYKHPTGLFLAADWSYKDDYFATGDLDNADQIEVDGNQLVNLRAGYDTGFLSVALAIRNLLDERYLTGRDQFGGAYVGDRRSVGIDVTLRFAEDMLR